MSTDLLTLKIGGPDVMADFRRLFESWPDNPDAVYRCKVPGCEDSGWVHNLAPDGGLLNNSVRPCECQLSSERRIQFDLLKESVGKDIVRGLANREQRLIQKDAIQTITKTSRGVWLYGVTGIGKTYICARALQILFETVSPVPSWRWVIAEDLIRLWFDRFESHKARGKLADIFSADIIILNDADKMTLTANRENDFYTLLENAKNKGRRMIVSSNHSIGDFFARFAGEREQQARYNQSPIARRAMQLCIELHVGGSTQQELTHG